MEGIVQLEEWSDIVRYMYAEDDAQMLVTRLREAARAHRAEHAPAEDRPRGGSGGRGARAGAAHEAGRLPYALLIQQLLEFQLTGHLHYLGAFAHLFHALDPKGKGTIDESEFRQLVSAIDPKRPEEVVASLLEQVDPHNLQRISFSDCVHALAADLQRMNADEARRGTPPEPLS